MKRARLVFVALSTAFLGLGYLASQLAAAEGIPTRHAVLMDQPQIRILSAILLIGSIVLALAPEPKEDS